MSWRVIREDVNDERKEEDDAGDDGRIKSK